MTGVLLLALGAAWLLAGIRTAIRRADREVEDMRDAAEFLALIAESAPSGSPR